MKVDLPRAIGFNNDQPTEDVSTQLQTALNKVKAAGGGTLYLPGGRYLVNKPIKVPSGIELRGTWDVQHHIQSGGFSFFKKNITLGFLIQKNRVLTSLKNRV